MKEQKVHAGAFNSFFQCIYYFPFVYLHLLVSHEAL